MSWKFWKKDEMTMPDLGSSFSTNPFGSGSLGAAGSSLGSGARNDLGLGSSGLDLSDHFQPSGNASAFGGLPPPGASQFGSQQQSFSAQNSFSPPPAMCHQACKSLQGSTVVQ